MKKKGFTLIEMIVVVAIISIIIPTVFAIMFVLVRQQVKVNRLNIVKQEGDYALNIIGNLIRNNATTIHSASPTQDSNIICDVVGKSTAGTAIYFDDQYGAWFGFSQSSGKISSSSSVLASAVDLTSAKTLISNFSVSCERKQTFAPSIVYISYDICYNISSSCATNRPEESAQLHYQTEINLRNN